MGCLSLNRIETEIQTEELRLKERCKVVAMDVASCIGDELYDGLERFFLIPNSSPLVFEYTYNTLKRFNGNIRYYAHPGKYLKITYEWVSGS